jgi:hypothetical protein
MLHIVAPSLFDKPEWANESHQYLDLPRLEALSSQSDTLPSPHSYLATLSELYGLSYRTEKEIPTAAICCYADSDEKNEHTYLLHADPVYLKPDQDRLIALDCRQQSFTRTEIGQFIVAFNQHFASDGLKLFISTAHHWYVAVSGAPDLKTQPLTEVIGRNIDWFLPQGADASRWISWMNEIQMLFHHLPVNRQRESQGQLPVSGLWFSGGGALPTRIGEGFAHVEGGGSLIKGLQKLVTQRGNASLMVDHQANHAVLQDDQAGWVEALLQLDKKLEPLMRNPLVLYPCNGAAWHWRPKMKWRWWRRNKLF